MSMFVLQVRRLSSGLGLDHLGVGYSIYAIMIVCRYWDIVVLMIECNLNHRNYI